MSGAANAVEPCTTTDCTGYRPDRTPCTCDARPYEPATQRDLYPKTANEAVTRRQHQLDLIATEDNHSAAVVALDDLMAWCRDVIGPVVALGQLSYHAEHQAFDLVAERLLAGLDRLEHGLAGAGPVIAAVRVAALDALGEGAP